MLSVVYTTNNDWIAAGNQTNYRLQGECVGVTLVRFTSSEITPLDVPCTDGQWEATFDFTSLDASTVDLEIEGVNDGEVLKTLTYTLNKFFEPTRVDVKLGQVAPGSTDGTGTAALFSNVTGITTDGTYLYIADSGNRTVKRMHIKTRVVETIAGIVVVSGSANGAGLSSTFNFLKGLTYHDGYLYISDYNTHKIRRLNTQTHVVEDFAGSGVSGTLDGIGTAARFNGPSGIVSDGTYIWVTERGNRVIRRITISTAEVIFVAGQAGSAGFTSGIGPTARFNGPIGISTDGVNLYIIEKFNRRIQTMSISRRVRW